MRIGIGYDIHRKAKGRPMVLGGITLSADEGLLGHSDADVLTHAIMDALLGAAGERDIGTHFPNSSEALSGISSLELLKRTVSIIEAKGFEISNVDATVIAESPRLEPHIQEMREKLAACLKILPGSVGIKATTNEGIGDVGRGLAVAAIAVALLRRA
ncbi:MAG: 2-C-methyl-D-erythritol 2,4-cyclodiphosphate synthase [Bacillota bacterium]